MGYYTMLSGQRQELYDAINRRWDITQCHQMELVYFYILLIHGLDIQAGITSEPHSPRSQLVQ